MRSRAIRLLCYLFGGILLPTSSTAGARQFTVADGIGIAVFGDISDMGKVAAITWSPDRKLVAVHVGRGLLASNLVESELRIYSTDAIRGFTNAPRDITLAAPPMPIWAVQLATSKEGSIIQQIRWSADSSAVAFLLKTASGRLQLVYADIRSKSITALSRDDQDVTAFDVADHSHYVYAVRDPAILESAPDRNVPGVDLSGRPLSDIIFPIDLHPETAKFFERSQLWVATGAEPKLLTDPHSGEAVALFDEGLRSLRLSPSGRWIATARAVGEVPDDWERSYRPASATTPYRINGGRHNVDALTGVFLTSQYALIDAETGASTTPIDAPTGRAAAWWPEATPVWSPTSNAIVFPSAFMPTHIAPTAPAQGMPPCVVVFELSTKLAHCLEALKPTYTRSGAPNPNAEHVTALSFADPATVVVRYAGNSSLTAGSRVYHEWNDGNWRKSDSSQSEKVDDELQLEVKQNYRASPVLQSTDRKNGFSRAIWDPNPQLNGMDLGTIQVLHWRDATGRSWTGGLYLPPNYDPAKRYPLVIQTHQFLESEFHPSGLYPTGYAALALAAKGIAVLETRCKIAGVTPEEGKCQAPGYEAAVKLLTQRGVIDPSRIGIIGFSRTCYYVLEALTRSKLSFGAAIITDGVNEGYWEYLVGLDFWDNETAKEANVMNSGRPVGSGLRAWLQNAPTFNMDKVSTPIQIVGTNSFSVMAMWEPYALLRYQKKPVDLTMLNSGEHVLTTPKVRMASQGGTIDWMRFWLQGHEDPDPAKRAQYARWERLCDLQVKEVGRAHTSCLPSHAH
jgi:dipeptidyl aminopeptidase/acylaminoacyl peptidase